MSERFKTRSLAMLVAVAVGVPLSAPVTGATAASSAPAMTEVTAVAAQPAEKKKKKKKKKRARLARVTLGIHNYQTQNAHTYLARPGVRLRSRVNCTVVMSTKVRQMAYVRDHREGAPFLLSGCGSTKGTWKYRKGPMSGRGGVADWSTVHSSATPKVKSYVRWLKRVKKTFGRKLGYWEVWNEVDLNNFYRGTPKDLVDLTFASAKVLGRKRVTSPSFSPTVMTGARGDSGAYVKGRFLSRLEFLRSYFRLLVKRARAKDVPLPFSVINIHTYGSGDTPAQAARGRLIKIRRFQRAIGPLLRNYDLPYWDTEWNLRRIQPVPAVNPPLGFRDTRRNAAIWARSARNAACLGVVRQYTYTWEDQPSLTGFTAGQLAMTPQSTYLNRAFRALANKRVKCKR